MSAVLLAEFLDAPQLTRAARAAQQRGCHLVDAFTPFPVEEVTELLGGRSHVRLVMLLGGFAIAAMAYGGEFYTAVVNYPYDAGGRPLHSWPAFMLVPFATGILAASIAGLIAFLVESGLPRLNFPLFAAEGFERATQDRFLLALARPDDAAELGTTTDWLRELGAVAVREVDT